MRVTSGGRGGLGGGGGGGGAGARAGMVKIWVFRQNLCSTQLNESLGGEDEANPMHDVISRVAGDRKSKIAVQRPPVIAEHAEYSMSYDIMAT